MDRLSHSPDNADREYCFGPFRFDPGSHALFLAGARVGAGRPALRALAALLEHPGRLVGVRELMALIWPGHAMHENNLAVHMSRLRKALGDDSRRPSYIATVNGRGYRFIAPVDRQDPGAPAASCGPTVAQPYALPAAREHVIGRAEAMNAVLALSARRRLVTVVGPGGIGKTVFALALARVIAQDCGAARFIDLRHQADACREIGDAVADLDGPRWRGRAILVLDACEQMSEATAARIDRALAAVPGLRLLATSRAPLGIAGEALYWLAPLAYPAARMGITAVRALRFPAIALFADRAARHRHGYRLGDADAPAAAAICERLEGHPMAIEMAAQWLEAFSVGELAARLDDRLSLLRTCRPGARIGHTSLATAFDWSFASLSKPARRVLFGLTVLPAPFTLDTASSVLEGTHLDAADIADGVGELVSKSLLQATPSASGMHYRLTATIRPYAMDKRDQVNAQCALPRRRSIAASGLSHS